MEGSARFYADLLEGEGLVKAKDLLAFWFPLEEKPLARLSRVADRFRKREPFGVVVDDPRQGLFIAQVLPLASSLSWCCSASP